MTASWSGAQAGGVTGLSVSLEPLQHSFNDHKGEPRFLALLSPT